MYNDITSIYIKYSDGSEEVYYVDWEDDIHPDINKNQQVENNNGYIFIVISKNKSEIMNNLLKEYSEEDLEFYDDFID